MKPLTRKDLDKFMDAHVLRDGTWCRKTTAKLGTDEIPRLVLLVEDQARDITMLADVIYSTGAHAMLTGPENEAVKQALDSALLLLPKEGR